MEQNNKRRAEDAERPACELEWFERPSKWTLLLTGDNHGLVGAFGSKWEGHPEHYERIDVQSVAAPAVDAAKLDGETIKPWKDRLFEDQPKLKGIYPNDDSGALDELGLYYAHAEIEDLRALVAQQAARIAELEQQLEAGGRDRALGAAIQRAAGELPEGWEIRIDVENGAGTATLYDPAGENQLLDAGDGLSGDIEHGIELAMEGK